MNNQSFIDSTLNVIQAEYEKQIQLLTHRITICAGTGCVANGSLKVFDAFRTQLNQRQLLVSLILKDEQRSTYLSKSGCQGFCQIGPLITIDPGNIFYTAVSENDVDEIIEKTILKGEFVDRLLYKDAFTGQRCTCAHDITFYKKQQRFVLEKCGKINPDDIREYIYHEGYRAAAKACQELSDIEICSFILESGLRGRGGGGFPTGLKWELTRKQVSDNKFIICNGDEGDPGAFMDRSVMEGNPHGVIEGIIIASKAIGAQEGYVYVRAEYPLAVRRMKKAVEDARKLGILGQHILGSDHSFDLIVMEGAGAFVCGEETALIASIEGNRGIPSPKPPFPAESGLSGKPTLINNVETFAAIPLIFNCGLEFYNALGSEKSKGTKTFALTGHVVNTGLIEVPFGTTLRHIINDIAGGVTNEDGSVSIDALKAVQIGGPSGGCLTHEHLDMPLDFDSLKSIGAMVGSGGLVVMNQSTCMVSMARFFMQFTQNESCGKCVLCREGTRQMLELLDDIVSGQATPRTLLIMEELAVAIQKGSLCGLGKTAPNPVLSMMKQFREEYEEHVIHKHCPTGQCVALVPLKIDPDMCKGCSACLHVCPVNAISGSKGKPYQIDINLCIKCRACIPICKFKAIKGA